MAVLMFAERYCSGTKQMLIYASSVVALRPNGAKEHHVVDEGERLDGAIFVLGVRTF